MADKETQVAADASATNTYDTVTSEHHTDTNEQHTNVNGLHTDTNEQHTSTAPTEVGGDEALRDITFEKAGESAAAEDPSQDAAYPQGLKLSLIVLSLMLAVFCVALDNTVHSRSIPSMRLPLTWPFLRSSRSQFPVSLMTFTT